MKTDTDRTYEQEEKKKGYGDKTSPAVTLSERGHTDVERKIESEISHTFFFFCQCLGNKVIILNKGEKTPKIPISS